MTSPFNGIQVLYSFSLVTLAISIIIIVAFKKAMEIENAIELSNLVPYNIFYNKN